MYTRTRQSAVRSDEVHRRQLNACRDSNKFSQAVGVGKAASDFIVHLQMIISSCWIWIKRISTAAEL